MFKRYVTVSVGGNSMKIDFEEWYKGRRFPEETIALFNEGVQCYKVGAYRATFLMTYLGFEWILKEKILKSSLSSKYLKEDTLRILKDPDEWERILSKIVINESKFNNPFALKKDILAQFEVWRHLRNACAHAKSNKINYSVIEHFWFFIMNNIGKFELEGGVESAIERLKDCYEYKNNLYATDIEKIDAVIEDLLTVEDDEIQQILIQVNKIIDIKDVKSDASKLIYRGWEKIVNTTNVTLKGKFIKFVKSDTSRFICFVDTYPQIFTEIKEDYRFMTDFWKKEEINRIGWLKYTEWETAVWKILIRMLKEDVIPQEEQDDFIEKIVREGSIPNDESANILRETNYFEKIEKILKSNDTDFSFSFDFVNKYADQIVMYLKYGEWDKELIKSINYKYNESSYGEFCWKMKGLFKDEEFYKKFNEAVEK